MPKDYDRSVNAKPARGGPPIVTTGSSKSVALSSLPLSSFSSPPRTARSAESRSPGSPTRLSSSPPPSPSDRVGGRPGSSSLRCLSSPTSKGKKTGRYSQHQLSSPHAFHIQEPRPVPEPTTSGKIPPEGHGSGLFRHEPSFSATQYSDRMESSSSPSQASMGQRCFVDMNESSSPMAVTEDLDDAAQLQDLGIGSLIETTFASPSTVSPPGLPAESRTLNEHGVQIQLSDEQERLRRKIVDEGKSIFFTGSAGTGKSVLLRRIIADLWDKYGKEAVAVTATTGIAAVNIGGTTLHSWAGIGLGRTPVLELRRQVYFTPHKGVRQRWLGTKVLVVDEISMLDAIVFDKLDHIGGYVRAMDNLGHLQDVDEIPPENFTPFGGIQLVLCGDFFQLPPVISDGDSVRLTLEEQRLKKTDGVRAWEGKRAFMDERDRYHPTRFVFDAHGWRRCVQEIHVLKKVWRQKDETFVKLLNQVRFAKMTQETVEVFRTLEREIPSSAAGDVTELYPTREEVGRVNQKRLVVLPGSTRTFFSRDLAPPWVEFPGNWEPSKKEGYVRRKLEHNVMAPQKLDLKVGATVMLIKNLAQDGLVNGSTGRVIGFRRLMHVESAQQQKSQETSMTKLSDGGEASAEEATLQHVGIARPADERKVDGALAMIQAERQRIDARRMEEASSAGRLVNDAALPKKLAYLGTQTNSASPPMSSSRNAKKVNIGSGRTGMGSEFDAIPDIPWPVVQFSSGQTLIIPEMSFEVQDAVGNVEVVRKQVPLLHGWALSIHKSQGQTLDRVKIDLGRTFAPGQAYVALSRATSLAGLQVLNFRAEKVRVDARVLQWVQTIEGAPCAPLPLPPFERRRQPQPSGRGRFHNGRGKGAGGRGGGRGRGESVRIRGPLDDDDEELFGDMTAEDEQAIIATMEEAGF